VVVPLICGKGGGGLRALSGSRASLPDTLSTRLALSVSSDTVSPSAKRSVSCRRLIVTYLGTPALMPAPRAQQAENALQPRRRTLAPASAHACCFGTLSSPCLSKEERRLPEQSVPSAGARTAGDTLELGHLAVQRRLAALEPGPRAAARARLLAAHAEPTAAALSNAQAGAQKQHGSA